jgi:hypothetical protein
LAPVRSPSSTQCADSLLTASNPRPTSSDAGGVEPTLIAVGAWLGVSLGDSWIGPALSAQAAGSGGTRIRIGARCKTRCVASVLPERQQRWRRCAATGCAGAAYDQRGLCLVHLTAGEPQVLGPILTDGLERGTDEIVDLRGVRFDAAFVDALVAAAPRDGRGWPRLPGLALEEAVLDAGLELKATFTGPVSAASAEVGDGVTFAGSLFAAVTDFSQTRFGRAADFHGARFADTATFDGAAFGDDARFSDAAFDGGARFARCTFGDRANFVDASLGDDAVFVSAVFEATASFSGARFGDHASFSSARFGDQARFALSMFGEDASFFEGRFGDQASFADTTFGLHASFMNTVFGQRAFVGNVLFAGRADFLGASFGDDAALGPLVAADSLVLGGLAFGRSPSLYLAAPAISLDRMVAPDGATIRLTTGDLRLTFADLGAASLLTAAPATEFGPPWQRARAPGPGPPPRLLDLHRTTVGHLAIAGVDVRPCRFRGAIGLDALRIEGGDVFEPTPAGSRGWRWTQRRAVAEEHEWRARYERGARRLGWAPPTTRPRLNGDDGTPSPPSRHSSEASASAQLVETVYRSLRTGLEAVGNAPASADLYYGEMEMRRAATPRGFERALLTAYWALSGYGLRAWRSVAALAVLLLVGTLLFTHIGFAHPTASDVRAARIDTTTGEIIYEVVSVGGPATGYGDALHYSTNAATSLLRDPGTRDLTGVGQIYEAMLRLAGPAFLGLTVLALRGRVRR